MMVRYFADMEGVMAKFYLVDGIDMADWNTPKYNVEMFSICNINWYLLNRPALPSSANTSSIRQRHSASAAIQQVDGAAQEEQEVAEQVASEVSALPAIEQSEPHQEQISQSAQPDSDCAELEVQNDPTVNNNDDDNVSMGSYGEKSIGDIEDWLEGGKFSTKDPSESRAFGDGPFQATGDEGPSSPSPPRSPEFVVPVHRAEELPQPETPDLGPTFKFGFANDDLRPDLFHIHLTESESFMRYMEMFEAMQQYDFSVEVADVGALRKGSLLAVMEHGERHRAEFLAAVSGGDSTRLRVRLIDYGEVVEVDKDSSKILPRQFARLAPTAIPCRLFKVITCYYSLISLKGFRF